MTTAANLAAALRDALDARALTHGAALQYDRIEREGRAALAAYEAEQAQPAPTTAAALVHAYEASAGSVEWSHIDNAHRLAVAELGPERVAAIAALYADEDDERAERIAELCAEGMTNSDAQAIADAEGL